MSAPDPDVLGTKDPPGEIPGTTGQYLTLALGGEHFGIPVLKVRELIEYRPTTKIPSTPACIRGVTSLRGRVLPVVDLAIKLALPQAAHTRKACIVVVDAEWVGGTAALGFVVDEVLDIVDLGPGDLESPPPFGTRIRLDFLTAIGKTETSLVLLLDIDKVLSPEELLAAVEAATPEAASSPPQGTSP